MVVVVVIVVEVVVDEVEVGDMEMVARARIVALLHQSLVRHC